MNRMFESIDALFDSGNDLTVDVKKQHEDRINALKESVAKKRAKKLLEQQNSDRKAMKESICNKINGKSCKQPVEESATESETEAKVMALVDDGVVSESDLLHSLIQYLDTDTVESFFQDYAREHDLFSYGDEEDGTDEDDEI